MATSKAKTYNATMQAVKVRREEQRKKDRRNRFILFGVVIVVLALLVGLVAWALTSRENDAASGAFAVSDDVTKHRGFLLGQDGVGKETPGAPVVEIYYDYTCGHCVDFEHQMGEDVMADVQAGKYTLVLHPVLTQAFSYQYPATELAARVYEGQPEKFHELHVKLADRMYEGFVNKDYENLVKDPVASVRKVGEEVGIKPEILAALTETGSQQLLQDWSEQWTKQGLREDGRYGTPMFVKDGSVVEKKTFEEIVAALRD